MIRTAAITTCIEAAQIAAWPAQPRWNHHPGDVSNERVGDVQRAQGDLAGALKSYRDGLAIAERLARSDPSNAGWQRDLSVSHDRIDAALQMSGDRANAVAALTKGREIIARASQSFPGTTQMEARSRLVGVSKTGAIVTEAI